MNLYCNTFIIDFDSELQDLKLANADIIVLAHKAIEWIENKINELFDWLKKHQFESLNDEIYFFKEIKPKIFSQLIFYKKILDIEANAPCGKLFIKKHIEKKMDKTYMFPKKYKAFYQYYRSKSNFNDNEYFVRNNKKNIVQYNCYLINTNVFIPALISEEIFKPTRQIRDKKKINANPKMEINLSQLLTIYKKGLNFY